MKPKLIKTIGKRPWDCFEDCPEDPEVPHGYLTGDSFDTYKSAVYGGIRAIEEILRDRKEDRAYTHVRSHMCTHGTCWYELGIQHYGGRGFEAVYVISASGDQLTKPSDPSLLR